jgi:hypothetical protein
MREQLSDIIRQVAPLFKKVKITGTETSTKVEAVDDDKILFMVANLKQPIPEFIGEFGIGSLSLLDCLLKFPSYKADDSQFKTHHNETGGYLSEFEFREKRGGYTRFKTMDPRRAEQATIAPIPWNVTVMPTKASIAELTQLAAHLSEVDTMFGVKVENKTWFVTIGGGGATHTSSVVFAADVEETFVAPSVTYNTKHLLGILKNGGANPSAVRFSERGLAGITVDTEHATYNYYLRAKPI